jgi:hypothetical protein
VIRVAVSKANVHFASIYRTGAMKHERENEKALSDLAGKQKHQCFVVISTKKKYNMFFRYKTKHVASNIDHKKNILITVFF